MTILWQCIFFSSFGVYAVLLPEKCKLLQNKIKALNLLDRWRIVDSSYLTFTVLLLFTIVSFCSLHSASRMLHLISFTWPSIHYVILCLNSAQQSSYFKKFAFAEASMEEEYKFGPVFPPKLSGQVLCLLISSLKLLSFWEFKSF